jgi:hypothetical protein
VPISPAPPASPFCQPFSGLPFTMADHEALQVFRRKLRRKAIWAIVTPRHHDLPEVLEVYRPYEVPDLVAPSWMLWRTAAGVWLHDQETGPLGEVTTLVEALEVVEAILKTEMQVAVRAIPLAVRPQLPKPFHAIPHD